MTTEAERMAGYLENDGNDCKCAAYGACECACGANWAEYHVKDAAKLLRSQAAEIERLKSTPPDQREDLRCVIADLMRQCQESDALLRQALDAMQWEVGGEPLPTLMMESIAAIKQHLGEV